MSKITEKEMRYVEILKGVKCDVCGTEENLESWQTETNYIEFSLPSGGWGESSNAYHKHFCSLECVLKLMEQACFGGELKFGYDFVNKSKVKRQGDANEN